VSNDQFRKKKVEEKKKRIDFKKQGALQRQFSFLLVYPLITKKNRGKNWVIIKIQCLEKLC